MAAYIIRRLLLMIPTLLGIMVVTNEFHHQTATTTFRGTWAPEQLAGLAAVRAVETGRPALEAGLAGTSAAFDARGQRLLWHPATRGVARVALPLAVRETPFDRYGDWVPALSVVAVALALVVRSLAGQRVQRPPRPGRPASLDGAVAGAGMMKDDLGAAVGA